MWLLCYVVVVKVELFYINFQELAERLALFYCERELEFFEYERFLLLIVLSSTVLVCLVKDG